MSSMMLDWPAIDNSLGRGVRILVIDSGIESSHPVFAGHQIRSFVMTRSETPRGVPVYGVSESSASDAYGHGTAVASIIATYAPAADIHSLQLLDGRNRTTQERVVRALEWAVEQRYDVVNCSFGVSDQRVEVQYRNSFKAVVDEAFCRGCILVAACNNHDFKLPEYPGAFPTVIASDWAGFDGLSFARREGNLVEFVARGRDVRVAWKGGSFRHDSGSSYAAPHTAALIARIRELRPHWNAAQVMSCLYELAREGHETRADSRGVLRPSDVPVEGLI